MLVAGRLAQGAAASRGCVSDDLSRARCVGLERAESAVLRGRPRPAVERRARLEEELALALAVSDRERVSELRAVLAAAREVT